MGAGAWVSAATGGGARSGVTLRAAATGAVTGATRPAGSSRICRTGRRTKWRRSREPDPEERRGVTLLKTTGGRRADYFFFFLQGLRLFDLTNDY